MDVTGRKVFIRKSNQIPDNTARLMGIHEVLIASICFHVVISLLQ